MSVPHNALTFTHPLGIGSNGQGVRALQPRLKDGRDVVLEAAVALMKWASRVRAAWRPP